MSEYRKVTTRLGSFKIGDELIANEKGTPVVSDITLHRHDENPASWLVFIWVNYGTEKEVLFIEIPYHAVELLFNNH